MTFLPEIVGSWKSFTAKRANSQIGRSGPFWHADYFDRFMRDEGHLARTVDYVENNAVKVSLSLMPSTGPEFGSLPKSMSGPEARGPRGRSAR